MFKRGMEEAKKKQFKNYKEEILTPKVFFEGTNRTLDLGWYWSENKEKFQLAKIDEKDRATHFYVVGATGTGKTKFLEYLTKQDIKKRNGFGVIDPHGDLIEDIKDLLLFYYSPDDSEISEKVVLIDPTDPEYTVTFNPLEKIPNVSISEQANGLVSSFKKIWSDSWGVRMEDLMRNSLISLGEAELTLTELPFFLTKRAFRKTVMEKVGHSIAKNYFQRFDTMTDRGQVSWIEPVMNKINAFFSDDRIRQMFSSNKSSFNIREIMDQSKILLIKLDKGKLLDSADLLGSLLMAKIQMAAFSRSDIPQKKRVPFYLYIDEFQNFASESFAVILSEARKYGLSLIMAHQTLAQIPTELRSLILGNAGIQVCFRLNRQDSNLLAKETFEYSGYEVKTVSSFSPKFWSLGEEWEHYISELQNLPPRYCYVKHKIEGGVVLLQTVDIKMTEEILNMDEDQYQKFIKGVPFGRKYLESRSTLTALADKRQEDLKKETEEKKVDQKIEQTEVKLQRRSEKHDEFIEKPPKKIVKDDSELAPEEIGLLEFISKNPDIFVTQIYKTLKLSGYKGDRLKESLLEKELIIQEETRKGKRGRLAKVLVLTEKGTSTLKKLLPAGKGGELHKQLQAMIKDQAEVFGWKANIEERIPHSLDSVDIGLKKDDVRVAIEVSSTTYPEQELQNIRKCLNAGYDYVISVSSDEKNLLSIKKEARKVFTLRDRERIRFSAPSQVKEYLKDIVSTGIVSEKGNVSDQIKKQKELMGTKEASEFLGIKKQTLYEWVVQRKIPFIKVGRLTKFRKVDLEAWLDKRTKEEEDLI